MTTTTLLLKQKDYKQTNHRRIESEPHTNRKTGQYRSQTNPKRTKTNYRGVNNVSKLVDNETMPNIETRETGKQIWKTGANGLTSI